MVDSIEEEMALMQELAEEPTSLSAEELRRPLKRLFSKPAISVDISATVGEALAPMRAQGYGAVVVTQGGQLKGILTERDLLMKVFGVVEDYQSLPVADVMTPNPVSLQKGDAISHVVHHMHLGGYRHVPIVDENDVPVSIVSIKDVLRYFLNFFPKDVMNVTVAPRRGGPAPREGG